MKRKLSAVLTLALLASLNAQLSICFAQGSLTPPGAPAPTMKTLAQIEPRTAISSAPFTINASGSYYLTTNLTVSGGDAITIVTNGVTLDLNGFTISSTAPGGAGNGIVMNIYSSDVTILNGHIQGAVTGTSGGVFSGNGFLYGINGPAVQNVRISGVSVSGCLAHGIYLLNSSSTVVESCTVVTVGGQGILADTIADSTAFNCGSDAIWANQATRCHGQSFGGNGVRALEAQNCYGTSSSGIAGVNATTAENCWGQSLSSASYGLLASVAQNCHATCTGNNTGLSANSVNNCYGYSSGNGTGLIATGPANNSYGRSVGGVGLSAESANNCYGICSGNVAVGLNAAKTANNCYGEGSTGINAGHTAQNSSGVGHSGYGILTTVANNCYGNSLASGVGIQANIAIGCYGQGTTNDGISAGIANSCAGIGPTFGVASAYKYNMPP